MRTDDPAAARGQSRDRDRRKGLTRRFGDFTAVDHVNFTIERGEIFGFLGSNGCGKSTTMKMLTGLLPPTEGEAHTFGQSVEAGRHEVRKQRRLHVAGLLALRRADGPAEPRLARPPLPYPAAEGEGAHRRACRAVRPRPLSRRSCRRSALGLRQRLSLAVAVLHEPHMLILDEPTSGVDPVARDSFWELLIDLSRKQGVTIFITTHFMNEAMRCDRISLMNAGKVLACRRAAEAHRSARRRDT